jgi:arylsulfatase A-like enzyme/Flp pilus assembly protein TadD
MGKKSKKKKNKTSPPPKRPESRRRLLAAIVLLALAVVGWLGWLILGERQAWQSFSTGAFKDYNILLISIDTLRADRLDCLPSSSSITPNLDAWIADSLCFDNVLAHVPVTLPSHTSMFSARYPTDHGVRDNGTFRVDPSLPTLPTVLSDAGYRTGAFVGAFVLDARFGLNRGFDVYDDFYGEKRAFASFVELERRAEEVVTPAEEWIGNSETPWYAWVHLFDPHAPYEAPEPFRKVAPNDPYDAEVAYVDDVLGSFLQRLRSAGKLEKTLVVVVGDHGESLGDHGERTHGTFAYNTTLRVPWFIWAAEGLHAQVFRPTVRHIDLMPTLLDFVGLEPPQGIEGRTLRPYLTGESYGPPLSYFEALNVHLTRDWAPLRGVVQDGYKYIRLPIPELYDLEQDPEERHNIASEKPEIARDLDQALQALVPEGDTFDANLLDLETVERLQALGYVTAPVTTRKSEYTDADDPKNLIEVSNAYDEASDLFAQGQTDQALAILDELIEKQPRSSQAYQKLAYALHQTGRLAEAIGALERALEAGVHEMSLTALLSAYLLEADRVGEARGLLEELVRRHPDYAEGHNYLGVAYGRLGLEEESRLEFEKVIELDPSSARTYNNLGALALGRGDFRQALGYFEKALRYDPDLAVAHNGLGVAYAQTGEMTSAVESWKRAVELAPRMFDTLYNLGMVLADQAPGEAVAYLERFAREAPPERYSADIEKVRTLLRRIQTQ